MHIRRFLQLCFSERNGKEVQTLLGHPGEVQQPFFINDLCPTGTVVF
jgi:hypothetical protein